MKKNIKTSLLRSELKLTKNAINSISVQLSRDGQNKIGLLLSRQHKNNVSYEKHSFDNFEGEWIHPAGIKSKGAVLYLHGGGYTTGGLEYCRGFGSLIADSTGADVLTSAYRLAPENPFPAALEDAYEAYMYMLSCGYESKNIVLCGESAGGGLCYALSMMLRDKGKPMPGYIIAFSPWVDLTCSLPSHKYNKKKDPSLTTKHLIDQAIMYASDNLKNPYVSPLYGDLSSLPDSRIFVGGDEILLNDSMVMCDKLKNSGSRCSLTIKNGMWHAYVLFGVKEAQDDLEKIKSLIQSVTQSYGNKNWLKLDNAAKIYPAARKRNWSNVFRVSATLKENVDVDVLKSAIRITTARFPSIAVRLRRGVFWYYLEKIDSLPEPIQDSPYPCQLMKNNELKKCAFRVLYYNRRISIEVFHALTDGTGAMIFLKSLVAEYITQKYKIRISSTDGVIDRTERPSPEEIEDSFVKNKGDYSKPRNNAVSYKIKGIKEPEGYLNIITGIIDLNDIRRVAKSYDVSITNYLTAVMIKSVIKLQNESGVQNNRQKPVSILVPINLRPFFSSKTLRNFSMFANVGVDPKEGQYSMEELTEIVKHQMKLYATEKNLRAMITTNVKSEQSLALRLVPLFIKDFVMKMVYNQVGERTSSTTISNLGLQTLPAEMDGYVDHLDFVLGILSDTAYNCSAVSYGDKMRFNFTNNIESHELERLFFTELVKSGIHVLIENNEKDTSGGDK